jgi:hypothetical protein
MSSQLKYLINHVSGEENPELVSKVMHYIGRYQKRRLYYKLYFSMISSMSFIAAFVYVFKYTLNEITSSGFYEYFRLIFSDGRIVLHFWKDFTYSLLSVLPTVSLSLTLFLLFSLVLSVRYFARQLVGVQLSLIRV